MYISLIKLCLLRAKWDLKMRPKWDDPSLHRDDNCLMTNGSFKYVTSVNNGYTHRLFYVNVEFQK